MKRTYILFITLFASFSLGAQTYIWQNGKMLQSISDGEIRFEKISPENFSTAGDVNELINSLYWLMGGDKSYRNRLACGYQGMNTDIEHGYKYSGRADWNIYTITPNNTDLSTANGKDPWNYLARMVYNATMIIDGICMFCDTMQATHSYYLGEALFLRAFAMTEMIKLWGDVPQRWKIFNSALMPMEPKQDRNALYESARADLKRAANLLPWAENVPAHVHTSSRYKEPTTTVYAEEPYMEHQKNQNYTGIPTKAAALGLLARLDLNYAGYALRPNNLGVLKDGFAVQLNVKDAAKRKQLYAEALDACAQVINKEGNYKFLANYEQIFKNICADVTEYNQSEVIWEIPFADGARGQFLQYNCIRSSDAVKGLKNNDAGSTNSAVNIVPTLYNDYEIGDVRRDVTIAPWRWYYDDGRNYNYDQTKVQLVFPEVNVESGEKFLYQRLQSIDSWYLGKYRIEWMARMRSGNDDGVNYPVIRYADILLMFCEASLGGITGDVPQNTTSLDPQALFDRVRARAGVASKTLTMENLMKERKLEFAGEYLRKYDLIRWGKLRSAMVNERKRINELNQHTGEFANTADTIYYKYRYVGTEYSYDASIKGYILDSLTYTRPANYDPNRGWCQKNLYESTAYERILSDDYYFLYDYEHPEYLDSHQLWPIFTSDMMNAPEGYLWNDYNYYINW